MRIENLQASLLASLFGLMAIACAHGDRSAEQRFGDEQLAAQEEVKELTRRDRVAKNPEQYVDQLVKMEGMVTEIHSPYAFRVRQPGIFRRNELIVMNNTGYDIPLRVGDRIEVLGPVRMLTEMDADEKMSQQLAELKEEDLAKQPIIMAQQLTGHWDELRPSQQVVAYGEGEQDMIPKQGEAMQAEQQQGEYFSACRLTVFYKTPGAVGNPCATTEEYAASILNEQQLRAFESLKETAGKARTAH